MFLTFGIDSIVLILVVSVLIHCLFTYYYLHLLLLKFETNNVITNCFYSFPDKILLNNGILVGEYEVADVGKELSKERETEKSAVLPMDLNTLPQTDSQEYVLNWCNNQELIDDEIGFTEDCLTELDYCGNKELATSKKILYSSKNSSVKSNDRSEKFSNSNSPAPSSSKGNKRKLNNVTFRNKSKYLKNYISKDICKYKESSRESGILTLQISSEEDAGYSGNDFEEENNSYDNDQVIKALAKLNINENKDTSSDYCTCTETSETSNVLEKTIYGFSSNRNRNTLKCNSIDDKEHSFICVSEVYKYADPDEHIVLYEKIVTVSPANRYYFND